MQINEIKLRLQSLKPIDYVFLRKLWHFSYISVVFCTFALKLLSRETLFHIRVGVSLLILGRCL